MGISIMILSLSNLCLIVIAWRLYEKQQWSAKWAEDCQSSLRMVDQRLTVVLAERDELLRQKKSLTYNPVKAQHEPKKVSGAELRRIVGQENSRFLTERERPNSEILKEHSNG